MLAWPTLIEGVKRINVVIVNLNQWAGIVPRHDPYAIDVDIAIIIEDLDI